MKKPRIAFIEAGGKLLLLCCCLALASQFSCKEKSPGEGNQPETSQNPADLPYISQTMLHQSALMLALGQQFASSGSFPAHLKEVPLSKELSATFGNRQELFRITLPGHDETTEVREISSLEYDNDLSKVIEDSGKWIYFNNPASKHYGKLLIDCNHRTANSEGRDIKFYQLVE